MSLLSPNRTGIYTSGTFTYSSTIDSSITSLYGKYCYDNGVNAALPAAMPVIILMHGYSGTANNLLTADMERFASYGYFVVAFGMRGRNSASGTPDASAREIHDIVDGLVYVQSNFASVVHATHADIVGWSGGGGNAMAALMKCPDFFGHFISLFGISDYGYRPVTGFYQFSTPSVTSTLNTDIGTRASTSDPYLARLSSRAVGKILKMGGFLELFHDTADTIVSVESSRQVQKQILAQGLGASNYLYHESTVGDTTRWLHGDPSTNPTQMQAAEALFVVSAREGSTWNLPSSGTIAIGGWFRSRAQDFEIWMDSSSSPKTNGTGGQTKTADIEYDAIAGIFKIQPISTTGTIYVTIRLGSTTKNVTITDATKLTIVEMYGV